MTPGEHELQDAERIWDPKVKQAAIDKINERATAFWGAWEEHVGEACASDCGSKLSRTSGLLYNGKAYCASCRNEIWNRNLKRVGVYP